MKQRKLPSRLATLKKLSPQGWFLVFGVFFGLTFIAITPPFGVPDEFNHLLRAYQVSEGRFLPEKTPAGTGGTMPVSLYTTYLHTDQGNSHSSIVKGANLGPLEPEKKVFIRFENTALYSPLVYLPQSIGVAIGRLFHAPPLVLLYLARLCNLALYLCLVYVAIRMLPFGKWAAVAIGLLPMHLLLASSASADPFSVALLLLTVAAVLHARASQNILGNKQLVLLLGIAVALALSKLPLILLLGLYLLIPLRVLRFTRKRLVLLGTFAVAGSLALIWLGIAKSLSSTYGPSFVDKASQTQFLLHHPISYFHTLYYTYFTGFNDQIASQYVTSVGQMQLLPPLWVNYLYTAFLAYALFPIRSSKGALRRKEKIYVGLIGLCCIGVISTLLYVSWSSVAATTINGLQARYFTPLLFLLIPIMAIRSTPKLEQAGSLSRKLYIFAPALFLLITVMLSLQWSFKLKIF